VTRILDAGISPRIWTVTCTFIFSWNFDIVVRIARRFGIAGVRCPAEQSAAIYSG